MSNMTTPYRSPFKTLILMNIIRSAGLAEIWHDFRNQSAGVLDKVKRRVP
jgi:hypothetical protein